MTASWEREEWLAARDADSAQEHPLDCMCGCRYDPADRDEDQP